MYAVLEEVGVVTVGYDDKKKNLYERLWFKKKYGNH